MVVAEDAPAGVEHVLLQCAGRGGVAERPQTAGEVCFGGEGVGVVVTKDPSVRAVAALALVEIPHSGGVVARPSAGVPVDFEHRIPQPQPRRTARFGRFADQRAGVWQDGQQFAVSRHVGPRHPVDNGEGCGA